MMLYVFMYELYDYKIFCLYACMYVCMYVCGKKSLLASDFLMYVCSGITVFVCMLAMNE